jgi:hypothetical protein
MCLEFADPRLAPVVLTVTIMMIVAPFVLASTLLLPLAFTPFIPFMPIMLAPLALTPSVLAPLQSAPSTFVPVAVGRSRRLVDYIRRNICSLLVVAISEAQFDAVLMREHGC